MAGDSVALVSKVASDRRSRKLRLLFVHEVNWRRKVVYEIHDFPELLSLRGHECVFIDFPESEPRSGVRRLWDVHMHVSHCQGRAHAGATVEVRSPGRVLPPPLDRLCASVSQVPAIWRALRDDRFDAMVLYAVPTNGWQALTIARHFGIPVLFRAIDVSHALRRSVFAPLVSAAERFIYRGADWVSCNNEALREYVEARGAERARTSVDYPGLDLERFGPGTRSQALCARYGIEPHHQTVMFMGTLYRFAGLDWFVDEFAPALRANPCLRLLIFGGGEYESEIRAKCAALGISDRVIAPGFVDYSELADHIRLADVAINPFCPDLVTHCALPSKVVQYLGCAVPAVSTPLRGMMQMIPDGEGVYYRNPGTDFCAAVSGLIESASDRARMSRIGREQVERLCDWTAAVDRLEAAVRSAAAVSRSRA